MAPAYPDSPSRWPPHCTRSYRQSVHSAQIRPLRLQNSSPQNPSYSTRIPLRQAGRHDGAQTAARWQPCASRRGPKEISERRKSLRPDRQCAQPGVLGSPDRVQGGLILQNHQIRRTQVSAILTCTVLQRSRSFPNPPSVANISWPSPVSIPGWSPAGAFGVPLCPRSAAARSVARSRGSSGSAPPPATPPPLPGAQASVSRFGTIPPAPRFPLARHPLAQTRRHP
jgi:hypothetical protein